VRRLISRNPGSDSSYLEICSWRAGRLDDLESRYDEQFKVVFDAIRELKTPPAPAPRRRIGFVAGD